MNSNNNGNNNIGSINSDSNNSNNLGNANNNSNNNNENNEIRKYIITDEPNPLNAKSFEKSMAKNYIDRFNEERGIRENPIEDARKGDIAGSAKKNIEIYNSRVEEGIPGQIIEMRGNAETNTVMARFENKDGSLAHEVVTSANTPPHITNPDDRLEHYENFDHMFGERKVDPPRTKRKRNGDDDEGGPSRPSGPSFGGSEGVGGGQDPTGSNSSGPSNFRTSFNEYMIVGLATISSIISSILDVFNEFFF
jgi:hypothetical protein